MKDKFKINIPTRYILFILTFLCIGGIVLTYLKPELTSPVRNVVINALMPMQKGLNSVGESIYNGIAELADLRNVQAENQELKTQLEVIREENVRLQQEHYELEELRTLLKLSDEYANYTMVGANVIQKSSGNWFHEFMIDKGTDDGVFVGANIMANGGLIGRVTEVGDTYAVVLSIISDGSSVGAMVSSTKETCIVSGDLALYEEGLLYIKYVDKDAEITDGEPIVTSNVSDVYLPGLLIGYTKDMTIDSNNLTQSGYLIPAAKFDNLQSVLIIMDKKETGSSTDEKQPIVIGGTEEDGDTDTGEAPENTESEETGETPENTGTDAETETPGSTGADPNEETPESIDSGETDANP